MAQLAPYLFFNRNCEEVFNFYKSVFGGEFTGINRYNEAPPQDGMPPINDEDGNLIMNIGLQIKDNILIMGSDSHPAMGKVKPGNNISLSYGTDTREETDVVFNKLAEGGQVKMPLADVFWGSYFGMLTDKFGIEWMVSFE